jgi:hypothetical protein
MPVGCKMKFGPLRPRYRPLILMPYDELLSGMADIELDPWLLVPAILLAFEEATKEPLLQIDAVVCVQCSIPWTSSHFCFDAERKKPSKLPRGWSGCPPQFAADNSGTLTFDQSGNMAS